jgi:hypothetical protein
MTTRQLGRYEFGGLDARLDRLHANGVAVDERPRTVPGCSIVVVQVHR